MFIKKVCRWAAGRCPCGECRVTYDDLPVFRVTLRAMAESFERTAARLRRAYRVCFASLAANSRRIEASAERETPSGRRDA
ncbi:hypothetical protein [Treponema endosymbiont of Eucomonympha sp.]|uniref:hypothetical protein n=1 Tax=Treponema endosymbiont of Eucomonympha sp. TaxID=1580831 RepID=UPI000786781D|nr:hypothetical protein [Treponema endosymbiont of Eucomonympha sp.]